MKIKKLRSGRALLLGVFILNGANADVFFYKAGTEKKVLDSRFMRTTLNMNPDQQTQVRYEECTWIDESKAQASCVKLVDLPLDEFARMEKCAKAAIVAGQYFDRSHSDTPACTPTQVVLANLLDTAADIVRFGKEMNRSIALEHANEDLLALDERVKTDQDHMSDIQGGYDHYLQSIKGLVEGHFIGCSFKGATVHGSTQKDKITLTAEHANFVRFKAPSK